MNKGFYDVFIPPPNHNNDFLRDDDEYDTSACASSRMSFLALDSGRSGSVFAKSYLNPLPMKPNLIYDRAVASTPKVFNRQLVDKDEIEIKI